MSEVEAIRQWSEDWNLFIKEVLGVTLDKEQQAIVTSVQHNSRTSVVSGTARGKKVCLYISCFSHNLFKQTFLPIYFRR